MGKIEPVRQEQVARYLRAIERLDTHGGAGGSLRRQRTRHFMQHQGVFRAEGRRRRHERIAHGTCTRHHPQALRCRKIERIQMYPACHVRLGAMACHTIHAVRVSAVPEMDADVNCGSSSPNCEDPRYAECDDRLIDRQRVRFCGATSQLVQAARHNAGPGMNSAHQQRRCQVIGLVT